MGVVVRMCGFQSLAPSCAVVLQCVFVRVCDIIMCVCVFVCVCVCVCVFVRVGDIIMCACLYGLYTVHCTCHCIIHVPPQKVLCTDMNNIQNNN